jgi:predicted RNA-binding Zn ribbon-like protein
MPQTVPAALALVQAFVNTHDLELHADALASLPTTRAWLIDNGLLDAACDVSESDRQALIQVREALRMLMLANNGDPLSPDGLATLDRHAAHAPLLVRFQSDGTAGFEPADGGASDAIGRLLAMVAAAMAQGTWRRLKACRDHTCAWAFFDTSKNTSRTWCNMQECGNRAKARAYQQRRRAAGT